MLTCKPMLYTHEICKKVVESAHKKGRQQGTQKFGCLLILCDASDLF